MGFEVQKLIRNMCGRKVSISYYSSLTFVLKYAKNSIDDILNNMIKNSDSFDVNILKRYPQLHSCKMSVLQALDLLVECFKNDGKLLVMGNGGSSADAEHLCAELVKGNLLQRHLHDEEKKLFSEGFSISSSMLQNGLPAMSLGVAHSFLTAFINDVHPEYIYAQQIWVHGRPNDIVFAISTSGMSKNIVLGLKIAKAKGLKTILLTGVAPNTSSELADISIHVPEEDTYKVQELHLPIYHHLCIELEKIFFDPEEGIYYNKFDSSN